MTARNELVEVALEELARFGIKGEVIHRGKHIEVEWYIGDQRRSSMMAATPSDHRAWLNVRGEVRRSLRADNVQPPPPDNVLSFRNAISLPKPVELPLDRIKRLEEDVTVLLDWLVEERRRADALEAKLANIKVSISFGEAQASPVPRLIALQGSSRRVWGDGPSAKVMAALAHGTWVEKQVLAKETGLDDKMLGATLNYLKAKKGLVENGQRGYWRKKPESQIASATG